MNANQRRIEASPIVQGVAEEISYRFDTTRWGGSPASPTIILLDGAGIDVTAEVTSGGTTTDGNDIETPAILNLTKGVYKLLIQFISGGNKVEAWSDLWAQDIGTTTTPPHGYCTVEALKHDLDIDQGDMKDDAKLIGVILAVSQSIESNPIRNLGGTGRRFYLATETRTFEAYSPHTVRIDDLRAITSLMTDDTGNRTYPTTWASTDYDMWPDNAAQDDQPYTRIVTTPNGLYSFPSYSQGVKIVGQFGYSSSTPPLIEAACRLQCERLFKRKDAPFGVAGSAEMGQLMVLPKLDPDVAGMIAPFRRNKRWV